MCKLLWLKLCRFHSGKAKQWPFRTQLCKLWSERLLFIQVSNEDQQLPGVWKSKDCEGNLVGLMWKGAFRSSSGLFPLKTMIWMNRPSLIKVSICYEVSRGILCFWEREKYGKRPSLLENGVNRLWFNEGGALVLVSLKLLKVVQAHRRSRACSSAPAEAAGARRRQPGLMKYSSLEFKAPTAGPVRGWPRDGDVSRSLTTPESLLPLSLPLFWWAVGRNLWRALADFTSNGRQSYSRDSLLIR